MRLLAVIGLLVPTLARADMMPVPAPRDTRSADAEQGMAGLTAALRAHDARAVEKHLTQPVVNGGVWFADATCAKRFAAPAILEGNDVTAFARCLARLTPQLSTRRSPLRDGGVLTVAPGFELEVAFDGTQVRWIGTPLQGPSAPIVPVLTAQAFEALRTRGTTLVDDLVGPQLGRQVSDGAVVSAWLHVCLDAHGTPTSVTHHGATSNDIGEAFVRATSDWAFRPFELRGATLPVCSLSLLTYPSAKAPAQEVLPPVQLPRARKGSELGDLENPFGRPPPSGPVGRRVPPKTIAASALERQRLTGTAYIEPDPQTRKEMIAAGRLAVHARVKLCVSTKGAVIATTLVTSSGFAAYDAKLVQEVQRWTYKPYLVNKAPREVCSTATFLFTPDPTMNRP